MQKTNDLESLLVGIHLKKPTLGEMTSVEKSGQKKFMNAEQAFAQNSEKIERMINNLNENVIGYDHKIFQCIPRCYFELEAYFI